MNRIPEICRLRRELISCQGDVLGHPHSSTLTGHDTQSTRVGTFAYSLNKEFGLGYHLGLFERTETTKTLKFTHPYWTEVIPGWLSRKSFRVSRGITVHYQVKTIGHT